MIHPTRRKRTTYQWPMVSYAQNFEDVILRRALSDIEAGFYIDIGAFDPVIDSVTCWFYSTGWRGINIEPNPIFFPALSLARPRDINLNLAITAERGSTQLHIHSGGLSTIIPDLARSHAAAGEDISQTIECETATLGDIFENYVQNRTVDFLKIDVEGSEAAILNSTHFDAVRPRIIVVEATAPSSTIPTWGEWHEGLRKNDYHFAIFDGLNRFYVRGEDKHRRSSFKTPPNIWDNFVFPPDHGKVQGGLKRLSGRRFSAPISVGIGIDAKLRSLSSELRSWFGTSALPLWWSLGADHTVGGFHNLLDPTGTPVIGRKHMIVQARQIHAFSLATTLDWPGPGREAARHGLDFLLSRYRSSGGAFGGSVDVDGGDLSEEVTLDGQASILLALFWAQRIGLPGSFSDLAETLVADVIELRRNPSGGFREADERHPWQSMIHMDLLEAFLSWAELSPNPLWRSEADKIATLALDNFIDDRGALPEFFDHEWGAAPGDDGRIIRPGHQFKWAHLLELWGAARGRDDACAAARKLFEIGTNHGVDRVREVAVNALSDGLSIIDDRACLWAQTERLKAALTLAKSSLGEMRERYLLEAAFAAASLGQYLNSPIPGLWRDSMNSEGTFIEQSASASNLSDLASALAHLNNQF